MKKVFPESFKFFPKTYLLPNDYQEFKNLFLQNRKTQTYIIKPEAESQGKGIFLTKSWENINPKDHYVAQKYLPNPYLIDGLKFDLRLYVLVGGCDPLRIYLFKDGLGRFATEPYCTPEDDNLTNMCMHLTNYAINKENPNFIFNDSSHADNVGHKKSLKAVFQILESQGHNISLLWEEIKKIVIKVLCSIQPILSQNYKSCHADEVYNNMCFEILGFDIMLDDKLKPWLIEVNHLPSFAADTPLDLKIKTSVIKDAFQLMNISIKDKIDYKNKKRAELNEKILRSKKAKLSTSEKQRLFEKAQKERDDWEATNSGGYEKIFPLASEAQEGEDYQEFIKVAQQYLDVWTGKALRTDIVRGFSKVGETSKHNPSMQLGKLASVPAAKKLVSVASPKITSKVNNQSRRPSPTKTTIESKKELSESLSPTHKSSLSLVKVKKDLQINLDSQIKRPKRVAGSDNLARKSIDNSKISFNSPTHSQKKIATGVPEEKQKGEEDTPANLKESWIKLARSTLILPRITEKKDEKFRSGSVSINTKKEFIEQVTNPTVESIEDTSDSSTKDNLNTLRKTIYTDKLDNDNSRANHNHSPLDKKEFSSPKMFTQTANILGVKPMLTKESRHRITKNIKVEPLKPDFNHESAEKNFISEPKISSITGLRIAKGQDMKKLWHINTNSIVFSTPENRPNHPKYSKRVLIPQSSRVPNLKTFWIQNQNSEASPPGNTANRGESNKGSLKDFIMLQGTTIYKNKGLAQELKK